MDEIKCFAVILVAEVFAVNEIEAEKHARNIVGKAESMSVLAAREDPLAALAASRDHFIKCGKCGKIINAEHATHNGLIWYCSMSLGGCAKNSGTYFFDLRDIKEQQKKK